MDGTIDAAHPGRALLCAGVLLALAALAADLAPVAPPILTGSDKLMQQYESFRAHVERDGAHDLLIVGNSVARQAVDTRALASRLGDALGRAPRAYNFGAGGTAAPMLPLAVWLAYGIDEPRHCVIVLIPRMIAAWTQHQEARRRVIDDSPYGRVLADPIAWRRSLRRFTLDHIAIFGLRHMLKDGLLGRARKPREPGDYDEALGFVSTPRAEALQWDRLGARLASWSLDPARVRPLARAVERAQAHGARVWLAEGAVHPRAAASRPDPDANRREMRELLQRVARETGATLLPLTLEFQTSDFSDTTHLNARGAARYTRWLADALLETGFGG